MAIQLPADVEVRIRDMIESGSFPDADDVMREALRLLEEEERQLDVLRAKLRSARDQLDRGEGIPLTPELLAEISCEAEERFRRGERPNPDVCP